MTRLRILGKCLAALACACLCLLATRPALAQDAPDSIAGQPQRGHRLLLELGFGYSLIHSTLGADNSNIGSASICYLVPLGRSRFDLGLRASSNASGVEIYGDRDTTSPSKQKLRYWTVGLRMDHHLVDFYDNSSGESIGWYGFVEVGRGQFKFPVALPSSPPYAQSVLRGTAINSGVGLWWLAGGSDYELFGLHHRRFSLQLASELGYAYVWGQADAGAFHLEFLKLGLSI